MNDPVGYVVVADGFAGSYVDYHGYVWDNREGAVARARREQRDADSAGIPLTFTACELRPVEVPGE